MAVPTGNNIDALTFQLDDKYLEQFNPLEVDQSNNKDVLRKHTSVVPKHGTYWNSYAGSQIRFEIKRNTKEILHLDRCYICVSSDAEQADGTDLVPATNNLNALGALNFETGSVSINDYEIESHSSNFEKIIWENVKEEFTATELEESSNETVATPAFHWIVGTASPYAIYRKVAVDTTTSGSVAFSNATLERTRRWYYTEASATLTRIQKIPLSVLFRALKGVDSTYVDKLDVNFTVYLLTDAKNRVDSKALTTDITALNISDIYLEMCTSILDEVEYSRLTEKRASGVPTYIKCLKPDVMSRTFTASAPIEITNQKNVQRATLMFDYPSISSTDYSNTLHYGTNSLTSIQFRYGDINIPFDRPITVSGGTVDLYNLFKESELYIKEKSEACVSIDSYQTLNHIYRVKFVNDIERPKLFDSNNVIFDIVGGTTGKTCYVIIDKLEVYKINADGQVIALIR